MKRSLRTRLTATIVGVVAAVLVVLAGMLYVTARDAAWRQHDDALVQRARALAAGAELDLEGYDIGLPAEPDATAPAYIEVWRPDGTVLARSASLGQRDLPRPAGDAVALADVTLPDGRDGRAVSLVFAPRAEDGLTANGQLSLVLADGTERVTAGIARTRRSFAALGLAALVLVVAITAWTLARGLRVKQLEAAMTREREFTADVSHELRTPLAGLRTTLEVARLSERSAADYQATIGDALVIVQQLSAVVENLLTLARVEAGQLVVSATDVPLRALVDDCWAPHAALAASRSVAFRNEIAAEHTVRCDRDQLRIVVGNLLANAAEYTEAGGWISVATGAGALVDVTDSGPPIAPADLEHIFDRLWRGDRARSATGVHCGIGLPLSRAICERLELSLTATSSPEGSVRFRVA